MWWRPVFKRGVLGALLVVGQLCVAYPTWSLPMNGKDGFHSVPNGLKKEWDGVESVLTSTFLGLNSVLERGACNGHHPHVNWSANTPSFRSALSVLASRPRLGGRRV